MSGICSSQNYGKVLMASISILLLTMGGCQLNEVRSKSKFGPEFRSDNRKSDDRTHNTRWTAQQGIEFKWDKGVTTGVTYRRRDVDGGDGDHDNGVWFELSFPLWKRAKEDKLARRVQYLEERIAQLESEKATEIAQTTD